MKAKVPQHEIRRRLLWIWGVGFLVNFGMLLLLMITTFKDHSAEALSWFSPTILPTLGLVVAALSAKDANEPRKQVPKSDARLAFVASVLYLLLVSFSLLGWALTDKGPLDWFKLSGLWLGPLQGTVAFAWTRFLTRGG